MPLIPKAETLTITKNTGISMAFAGSIIAIAVYGGLWAGEMEEKLSNVADQNVAQWLKLSQVDAINLQLGVLKGRLDTIITLLNQRLASMPKQPINGN